MSDLPKAFRAKLEEFATASALTVESRYISDDGTRRYLMKTGDGQAGRDRFHSDRESRYDLFLVAVGLSTQVRFLPDGKAGAAPQSNGRRDRRADHRRAERRLRRIGRDTARH